MMLFLSGLKDALFPPNCILCRNFHPDTRFDPVCPSCAQQIPFNTPPFCLKCSRHLDGISEEGLCPSCRKRIPDFDMAWGATTYTGIMQDLVLRFKFHEKTSLRQTFGLILSVFMARYGLSFDHMDTIIPIPLHPVRLRERGYNQALLLAEKAGQITGLPVDAGILERIRHTPRQSELGQKERFTNISRAFRIKPSSNIRGKRVLVVDDLLTTGATASEVARTLKDAGALEVCILTLSMT